VDERVVQLRQVFDDLVRFETVLWREVDARLTRACALGLGSFNVLLVVQQTDRCRVQDVARALAITVGGVSQAVDRLERAGWCARTANPSDRRSSVLELTPAGEALMRDAAPVFDAALDDFLAGPLSKTSLAHLAAALSTVRRAVAVDENPAP
jgi:DNA-binding MarR family transcriptional regulator